MQINFNSQIVKFQGIEDEKEIADEIEQMLESLGIEEKRHEMSKSLSGGLKRKLRYDVPKIFRCKFKTRIMKIS